MHHTLFQSMAEDTIAKIDNTFNINDPLNFVFLPANEELANKIRSSIHSGKHTNVAKQQVADSLKEMSGRYTESRTALIETIRQERSKLLKGEINLREK